MRLLFSVLMLLVVVAVLGKLASSQLQSLAGPSRPASSAQRAADLVQKAVEQGRALGAAEAASQ